MEAVRNPRQRFAAVGVTIVLVLGALAMPPTVAGLGDGGASVGEALKFRQTFGLQSDLSFVEAMALNEPEKPWPIPLTKEERNEMNRRAEIQGALAPLKQYGSEHSATFGGIWIDQQAGGVIDVAFTGTASAHLDAVVSLAPPRSEVRVREVSYSLAALRKLHDAVLADEEFRNGLGVTLYEVGPSVRENVVTVGLSALDASIEAAFAERYGRGLRLYQIASPVTTACNSRNDCIGPPLRGGINTNWGCTTGFMIREDGYNRWMTAGHCADVGSYWSHNGGTIGWMKDDNYHWDSYADAATVGDISTTYMSNYVYYQPNSSIYVWYKEGWNGDTEGQVVCQSGRVSGFVCGTLVQKHLSICYNNCTTLVHELREANYTINNGDSGAPVIANNVAMGVQSGRNGDRAFYSHIYWAEAQLGMNVYLGPCGGPC